MCYAKPQTNVPRLKDFDDWRGRPWMYTCQGIDGNRKDADACCYNKDKDELVCCAHGCGQYGDGCNDP